MKKNKRDNSILCYFGLFVLIVLLLLPPMLRLFGKNLYEKKEIKKDTVIILSCNKQNESISSTFLNSEPQNISYRIKGNYSVKEEEETENIDTVNLVDTIRFYAKIEYKTDENETVFSVNVSDLKNVKNYVITFNSLENQIEYFNSQGFYCEKNSY